MVSIAAYSLPIVGSLILAGGVVGFIKAKSRASLISSVISAMLFDLAFLLTFSNQSTGLLVGAVVSVLLCIAFTVRLKKTGKFMPAGMLLILSVAELAITLAGLLCH